MNTEISDICINGEINIDSILEHENTLNKSENWNKLNKTIKLQKLHVYAEKYGKDHSMSVKEIRNLKQFFNDALTKKKLNKSKDVVYEKQEVIQVNGLCIHSTTRQFTLRNDSKRVHTLKSLPQKKKENEYNNDEP